MNRLLTILFIFFTVFSSKAQYAVCTNTSVDLSHFAVSINTSTANANISVMIGENLNTRDFSIGLTDSPSNADVIILDNPIESDLIIAKTRLGEANLSIKYGEKLINPSVRIELIEDGIVDFLIYNKSESFDIETLILSLLPIINSNLDNKYDFIPNWGPQGGNKVNEELANQVIEPVYYSGINISHWITELEDGMILLDDNSVFYVYDEDRYISKLWQKKNDVVVSPTEVVGHYYITKDGGIYKEAETLRAVCVKGL